MHFRGCDRPFRALSRRPHFAHFWPVWAVSLSFLFLPSTLALKFLFKTVQNCSERSKNSVPDRPHFADFPAHILPIGSAFARVLFRESAHRANRARSLVSPLTLALFGPFLAKVHERAVCVLRSAIAKLADPKILARTLPKSRFSATPKNEQKVHFLHFLKNPKKHPKFRDFPKILVPSAAATSRAPEQNIGAGGLYPRKKAQRSKSHKTRQVRVSRFAGGARPWRVARAHTRAHTKYGVRKFRWVADLGSARSGWGRVGPKRRAFQNLKRP